MLACPFKCTRPQLHPAGPDMVEGVVSDQADRKHGVIWDADRGPERLTGYLEPVERVFHGSKQGRSI